ncbi:unnamed protein product [Urochloa humidicola]
MARVHVAAASSTHPFPPRISPAALLHPSAPRTHPPRRPIRRSAASRAVRWHAAGLVAVVAPPPLIWRGATQQPGSRDSVHAIASPLRIASTRTAKPR